MKYLIVVLFVLLLSCEKEKEGYCWECTSTAENYMYLAVDSTLHFGNPLNVTSKQTICDVTKDYISSYEKEGTSYTRFNDGLMVVIFKRTTKCSLNYTISYE
jgi:hypothetical protein